MTKSPVSYLGALAFFKACTGNVRNHLVVTILSLHLTGELMFLLTDKKAILLHIRENLLLNLFVLLKMCYTIVSISYACLSITKLFMGHCMITVNKHAISMCNIKQQRKICNFHFVLKGQ